MRSCIVPRGHFTFLAAGRKNEFAPNLLMQSVQRCWMPHLHTYLHWGVKRHANVAVTTFAQIYSSFCTNLHHICAEQIWSKSGQGTFQISRIAKGELALNSSPASEWVHKETFGPFGLKLPWCWLSGVGAVSVKKKVLLVVSFRSVYLQGSRMTSLST